MKRRKYLLGFGSLIAGSAAALGTGAFSSASIPERQVTAKVANDENAQVALVPGEDPDVSLSNDGELTLDLTGSDGEGVNINSVYTWGDPEDPANDHAFKIVNNDERDYGIAMDYFFSNTEWISNHGNGQSYLRFELYDLSPSNSGWSAENYPHQSYNKDYSLGGPTGDSTPHGSYSFNSGEEYYMIVKMDTTGPNASIGDDLSGTARFRLGWDENSGTSGGAPQKSWYPENPPNQTD
jgi:hypothetical protein